MQLIDSNQNRFIRNRSETMPLKSLTMMLLIVTILGVSCRKASTDSATEETSVTFYEELAIPDFTIATIQDSTGFSFSSVAQNELVLIKYFSPDCDHCQQEAQAIVSKKDSLRNIKMIWVAGEWASLTAVEEFAETYQLEQLNPLVIGKDAFHDLGPFYEITGVPFTAVYRDNQLIKEYRGSIDFDELIGINDGTYTPEPMVPEL
ncbi:MAG: protein disulfide isomerase family protein [Cytophagales bacterium]|nr:protein disulfide isomerase family protein [Cytophagales bacterium]